MLSVVPEFIGRRQLKIIVNGVKYKAKANRGCEGCAFGNAATCVKPIQPNAGNVALCAEGTRTDGTSIIWIKKDQP